MVKLSPAFAAAISPPHPKPLESAKEAQIVDGITMKMIVADLGPGWIGPFEDVGVIQWFFTDGRTLCVLPRSYDPSEVITYKGKNGEGRMWWESWKPDSN
jgi:hypothetical protein